MHKSITLMLAGTLFATLIGCNMQKAETIPATRIQQEPTPTIAEKPAPSNLSIGDNAPAISIDHWVKGDPINGFEDGKVYVMEFWATWCGLCVTSMPHLSSLQEEYGDNVKIIGVSSEKELETVTGFLQKINKKDNKLNSDRMRYTVTVDPDRSTSTSYMKAAGQNGIPTAFIINQDGKVAWIGHPMSMDEPLAAIVDGTWDLAAATSGFKKAQEQKVAMMNFRMELRKAQMNEEWDACIEAIDNFTAKYGGNSQIAWIKFETLLNGKKDKAAAYTWAKTMAKDEWDNASSMNSFAWRIVDEFPQENQDLDFALEIALRGCELTNYKNPMILDTLARCYWELGDQYKAIVWQEKAVENAEDDGMGSSIKATLDQYRATLANVDE